MFYIGNYAIKVAFKLFVLSCLLLRIVLAHLFNHGEIRLKFTSTHAVVVVLASLEFSQVEVLNCKVVIGTHFHVYILSEPS